MSDINLDFTVNNNSIGFTVVPNEITFTPADFNINIFNSAFATPAGNLTTFQFNNGGILGGATGLTYDSSSTTTTATTINVANINATQLNSANSNLGSVSNVYITGGSNNYALITNGSGNLSWIEYVPKANLANFATTVVGATQANITSLGNLTTLNVAGVTNIISGTEKINLVGTAPTGNYNFSFLTAPITYVTANATGNVNLNFVADVGTPLSTILASGRSITGTYVMTVGLTPYYITTVYVDGNSQAVKWVNGNIPTPAAAGTSSYTFTIINTGAGYTVLGGATRYA
jgi:hypothetical protein